MKAKSNLKLWAMLALFYGIINLVAARFIGTTPENVYNDFRPWAEKLLDGGGFGYRYPPGHVVWTAARLALARFTGIPYFHISLLVYIPVVILTFHAVRELAACFLSRKMAATAAWLFFFYPLNFTSVQMDVALPLYTLFLVLFVLHLIRASREGWPWSGMAISAIYLALAALIRPNPLLFPFLMAPVIVALNRFGKNSRLLSLPALTARWGFFILVFFLAISPWSLTASLAAGKPVLLSSGFLPSHRDGLRRFPSVPFLQEKQVNTRVISLSGAMRFHLENLVSHPVDYAGVWLIKILRCWYASDSGGWDWQFGLINLVYLLPAMLGAVLVVQKQPGEGYFLMFSVVYHWGLSVAVLSIARYQVPVMPFVCIYAAAGLTSLPGLMKRGLQGSSASAN